MGIRGSGGHDAHGGPRQPKAVAPDNAPDNQRLSLAARDGQPLVASLQTTDARVSDKHSRPPPPAAAPLGPAPGTCSAAHSVTSASSSASRAAASARSVRTCRRPGRPQAARPRRPNGQMVKLPPNGQMARSPRGRAGRTATPTKWSNGWAGQVVKWPAPQRPSGQTALLSDPRRPSESIRGPKSPRDT